jgi:RNA polymerase sigma-70 factor (ECF subfamily)
MWACTKSTEFFMDDREAIRLIKRGEIGGLEVLVNRYQVKAARAVFLITQNEFLSEDIVQETFIQLYQRIHHFDESRPFEPYLMRSMVNAALNTIRLNHRYSSLDADPTHLETLLDQTSSVETQVEITQQSSEILQALSNLAPRQRAVIVQRYYLEMSEQEMVQASGIAPGTIKWLLHAARTRLRELLASKRRAE